MDTASSLKKYFNLKNLQIFIVFLAFLISIIMISYLFSRYTLGESNVIQDIGTFALDYLPFILPLLTVALSISLKPAVLANLKGWLDLSVPLALGCVSFAIWAFVAGQNVTDFIQINKNVFLDKKYAVILVYISFIWTSLCGIIAAMSSLKHKEGESLKTRWVIGQSFMLILTCLLLVTPAFLFVNKERAQQISERNFDKSEFRVIIPYIDHAVNRNTILCKIYANIESKSSSGAYNIAKDLFNKEFGSNNKIKMDEISITTEKIDEQKYLTRTNSP